MNFIRWWFEIEIKYDFEKKYKYDEKTKEMSCVLTVAVKDCILETKGKQRRKQTEKKSN